MSCPRTNLPLLISVVGIHWSMYMFTLVQGSQFFVAGLCSQEEERLVRDLFRGYNKLIRPVQNMTQKVEVAFGLAFIQLINVVRFFYIWVASGGLYSCILL